MRGHKLRSGVNWQGVLQTKIPRVGVEQDLILLQLTFPLEDYYSM
jgi:hypothetical protein